ncbi:MAG: CapA family protein, partial [Treponemataceae bacterium]|nr:CapA family protein [Treponemataceae bacterium]
MKRRLKEKKEHQSLRIKTAGQGTLVLCLCGALATSCPDKYIKTREIFPQNKEPLFSEAPLDFRLLPTEEICIGAVGDIMLARHIGTIMTRDGWASPFVNIKPLFEQVNIGFANLESPAAFLGTPYPGKDPEITFRANPGTLLGLKYASIDVVSLANNHANDYGKEALLETIQALQTLGIAVCGAGEDYQQAHRPAIIEYGPYRIAFLAYAEPFWSVTKAGETAGVATIQKEEILADIEATKPQADLILISLHWGIEHQHYPLEKDRALAHALIDAGAHGIVGHHPHV